MMLNPYFLWLVGAQPLFLLIGDIMTPVPAHVRIFSLALDSLDDLTQTGVIILEETIPLTRDSQNVIISAL